MTEDELVKGCKNEDRHCQRIVFERYAGKMMTVSLRYARHRLEAEDILQESFVKVFNNIQAFQGNGSFEGWIRRIVVNTALRDIQKSSFKNEQIGLENIIERSEEPTAISNLSEQEILKLISFLPDGYRTVFNLYVFEDFSHREISQHLGIEESTSRSQLTKARQMLQAQIKKSNLVG